MSEEIAFRVTIGGEEKVIKSLSDLKRAKKEASDAFIKGDHDAAKAIAELNSKTEELGDTISTMKGSGIEKVEGSLSKLGEGFKTLDLEKIKIGFKGLGAAMSAVPLLLLVEGFKLLIEHFDEIVDWFKEATSASADLKKELEELQKANKDIVAGIDAQITALSGLKTNEQAIIDLKKKKLELGLQEKKLALEVALVNQQAAQAELSTFDKILQLSGNATSVEIARRGRIVESQNEVKKATQELQAQLAALQGFDNEQTQKTIDNNKKKSDDYKKNLEDQARARKEANDTENKAREDANQAIFNAHKLMRDEEAKTKAEEDRLRQEAADKEYAALQKSIEDNKKANEQKIKDEQDLFNAKLQLSNATIGIVHGLEQLAKKGSAAQKGLALTEIAAQTGVGFIQGLTVAQKAAAGTGPAAAFAFPIFYASQIAAVLAAVKKAKEALNGGGGASAPSVSSGGGQIPTGQAPVIQTPSNSSSTINKETGVINHGQNQPIVKAIVVETDITKTQNHIQTIKETATF